MELIEREKSTLRLERGTSLFQQGGPADGLYCIYLGTVKVSKQAHDAKDQIIRFAHPGGVVGCRSVIVGETHATTATSMESVRACFIPQAAIRELVDSDQQLRLRLLAMLAEHLRAAEDRIYDFVHHPLRARIAELLLRLHEEFGVERDGVTLRVRLSRTELANTVGAATETLIRILTELKHGGIIRVKGRRIAIHNLDRLKQSIVEDVL